MKISELIEKLQHQQNLYGDLPVYHDIGGDEMGFDEMGFEEIDRVLSVHPKDKNLAEDKNQAPWCIELV